MAAVARDGCVEEIVALTQAVGQMERAGCDDDQLAAQLGPRLTVLDSVAWAATEDELLAAGIRRATVSALGRQRRESDERPGALRLGDLRLPPGHPIDTLFRENSAIRGVADELSQLTKQAAVGDVKDLLERLRRSAATISEARKHHARVLNVLLPQLERRGLQGLTRTLWAYYSGVRSRLTALHALLAAAPAGADALGAALAPIVAALLKSLQTSMAREEHVLAPLLLRLLTEREWAGVWRDSLAEGWCLIEPGRDYVPADTLTDAPANAREGESASESSDRIRFAAGELSVGQVRGILATLPVDLTFVDENDAVRFFTERPERLFPRNVSVLGRKVQNCHPPSSLRLVNRILSEFRAGSRDVAEFWFQRRGQFIHVRYFAVRDERGLYLGTLEVAQDLARLRTLAGERRLLADDAAGSAADLGCGAESAAGFARDRAAGSQAGAVPALYTPAGE